MSIDPFADALARAPLPAPDEVYQWRDLNDSTRNAARRATPVRSSGGNTIEVAGLTLCRVALGAVQADIQEIEAKSAAAIQQSILDAVAAALALGASHASVGALGATGDVGAEVLVSPGCAPRPLSTDAEWRTVWSSLEPPREDAS